ncbi:lithostathine-1-like [Macrotis lagotis]|uniref:lithostathine-1-like n=1 Tax=Macrotis lagotis TaxID=92651 RepID=UPI003D6970E0
MVSLSFSTLLFTCLLLPGLTEGHEKAPAPPSARSSCPQGFGFHGSHCYGLLAPAENWNTAEVCWGEGPRRRELSFLLCTLPLLLTSTSTLLQLLCQEYPSGHLVSLLNAAEASFVATMIKENNLNGIPVWIGLHDPNQNGRWRWSSNALYLYQAWQTGFPTTNRLNYCVSLTSESGFQSWKNEYCENKYPYLCKFKA